MINYLKNKLSIRRFQKARDRWIETEQLDTEGAYVVSYFCTKVNSYMKKPMSETDIEELYEMWQADKHLASVPESSWRYYPRGSGNRM